MEGGMRAGPDPEQRRPTPEFSPEVEERRGDREPLVEELPDGGKRFSTRVVRPKVSQVKTFETKKAQIQAHEEFAQAMADSGRRISYPNYERDTYDYHQLMPEVGSPASIEVESDIPPLIIANVRHLAHRNNVVTPETQAEFRERAEHLIEDLQITPNTLVFVIASPAANFEAGPIDAAEGPTVHSRTQSTVDVIRGLLDEQSIHHSDNDLGIEGPMNSLVTDGFRRSLDEFQVEDRALNEEVMEQISANRTAQKDGKPLPFPESPTVPPTVYASVAPNAQDLEQKTGITEVASASVARGLSGFDLLEDYFLRQGNIPEGVDKVVVITGRHGQFCTDISEALLVATDGKHPIAFADNGAYAIVEARLSTDGEVVEDYIIQTGARTGMIEK